MSSASTKVNEDPARTEDEFRSQEEGGEIAIESEEAEEEDQKIQIIEDQI